MTAAGPAKPAAEVEATKIETERIADAAADEGKAAVELHQITRQRPPRPAGTEKP